MTRLNSLTTEQIRAEIAAAGGGGGGAVGGTSYADQWNDTRQFFGSTLNTKPSGGFDFRSSGSGGPRLGFRTHAQTPLTSDATYGWTQNNYVGVIVGDTGWFFPTLSYSARFSANPAVKWEVGFSYPGQDSYHYPVWDIPGMVAGKLYKYAWAYQPIHLNAGDEITFYSQSTDGGPSGQSDLLDNQFCLSLTTMKMEEAGVWTPPSGDSSYHFTP